MHFHEKEKKKEKNKFINNVISSSKEAHEKKYDT